MKQDEPATKRDVEEIVGRLVGEIVGDAMQLISERFDRQDATIGTLKADVGILKVGVEELRATTNRIENKLDATVDQVDDHEVRLKRLEHRTV